MKHYYILLSTPFSTWTLDPLRIPDLPDYPPVDMEVLVNTLAAMSRSLICLAAIKVVHTPERDSVTEAQMYRAIQAEGVETFRHYCSVRVIPCGAWRAEDPKPEPDTAVTGEGDQLRMHRDVYKGLMTKLATVEVEVSETLHAMTTWINNHNEAGVEDRLNYLAAVLPTSVVHSILHLARLDPNSRNLYLRDLLSAEVRSSLQTITHELSKADDGLGHTAIDSTAEGLLQEHAGAEAGDKHEQLLSAAWPHGYAGNTELTTPPPSGAAGATAVTPRKTTPPMSQEDE